MGASIQHDTTGHPSQQRGHQSTSTTQIGGTEPQQFHSPSDRV